MFDVCAVSVVCVLCFVCVLCVLYVPYELCVCYAMVFCVYKVCDLMLCVFAVMYSDCSVSCVCGLCLNVERFFLSEVCVACVM